MYHVSAVCSVCFVYASLMPLWCLRHGLDMEYIWSRYGVYMDYSEPIERKARPVADLWLEK